MDLLLSSMFIFILISVELNFGYSRVSPTSHHVCAGLVHGAEVQTGTVPYTIEVKPVRGGTALSVTLLANTGRIFIGFMLQARNALNKDQILEGLFSEGRQSQIKSCNSNKTNMLTHRNSLPKTKIQSIWTPSDTSTGEVIFRATFVGNKDWVQQDSEAHKIREGRVVGKNNREDHQIVQANGMRSTPNAILNYSVCDTKFCFGYGKRGNCVATKSCELLLSGGYINKEEGVTEFEFSAIPGGGSHLNKYFSMAFSMDQNMGDDLATDCYVTSEGKVKLGSSVNMGKDNQVNDKLRDSLNSIQSSYANGIVMCKWKSNRKRTALGREWDMLDHKYHILLAMGDLRDDNGTKGYHDSMKLFSNIPIAL